MQCNGSLANLFASVSVRRMGEGISFVSVFGLQDKRKQPIRNSNEIDLIMVMVLDFEYKV